jgi:hypothetical protein
VSHRAAWGAGRHPLCSRIPANLNTLPKSANPLVAIRRPRIARVAVIVRAVSKTETKADPGTVKAAPKAAAPKATASEPPTETAPAEAASAESTSAEAASAESTSTEATAVETPEAAATETTSAEASMAASAEAAVAASERQGICRNCCGAKETGRSERDSNLA